MATPNLDEAGRGGRALLLGIMLGLVLGALTATRSGPSDRPVEGFDSSHAGRKPSEGLK